MGQQKAHVSGAAQLAIKFANGDLKKINKGHIVAAAKQSGVPEEHIKARLKKHGVSFI